MSTIPLRQIYDLPKIKKYVWYNDIAWAARLAGVSRNVLNRYLAGVCTPRSAKSKLAWRLLVARSHNNHAFAEAFEDLKTYDPSVASFEQSVSQLQIGDTVRLAFYLKIRTAKIHRLQVLHRKGRRAYFRGASVRRTASAIILRIAYNQKLLAQIDPWLKEHKEHGAA